MSSLRRLGAALGAVARPVPPCRLRFLCLHVVAMLLAAGAAASLAAHHALAQDDNTQEEPTCPGDPPPVATPVEVEAVPIVVESTAEEYFVLYVRHDLEPDIPETTVYVPVSVVLGQDGTTTLAENAAALPAERYRVEKYLVSDPADVDGDCIDDIAELADPVGMNPVNPAPTIDFADGIVAVPDRETFEAISAHETSLNFVLFGMDTDRPAVYFGNAQTHIGHKQLLSALGFDESPDPANRSHGAINYYPNVVAPDGNQGVYVFILNILYPFNYVDLAYTVLAANLPLLDDNLAYQIRNVYLPIYQDKLVLYEESRINLVFDEHIKPERSFIPLNEAEGYGFLRVMETDERPNSRDVVVYEALPNELPRVAGIVTTVPQTPLSHVNLRAIQDGVPNAFIRDALDDAEIAPLIDGWVHYTVTETGWSLGAATPAEVDAHYESSRPAAPQTPQRDLSFTSITPLSEVDFEDWDAFGVKAANVAVLGTLGFPEGTVPDGFAVPFYFYDEFMKANGLHDRVESMLADPGFQEDFDTQVKDLKDLRKAIKAADTPDYMTAALTEMHASFPEGASLRYRSSTNNEDLPGFNGAGLYDSKTQHPEETEEDGISKSLKQVYASMWNFRAFTERDFHRIDHTEAAMGVLVHPNYSDERVNGVAVSFDPVFGREGVYYVNSQVGEDLVTNPEAHSVPEELLLRPSGHYTYQVLATSNQTPPGRLLMSRDQLDQLRDHLEVIHERFAELYGAGPDEQFAIEIEFKITSDNILAIKQARPWVFSTARSPTPTPGPIGPGPIGPGPIGPGPSGPGPSGPGLGGGEPAPVEPAGFTDVDPNSVHAPSIDALFAADITTGCNTEPLRYCPNQPVTRAHMATFLTRALDLTIPDEPAGFTDVDPNSVHAPSIDALFAADITTGCNTEPLRYCPNQPVTRAHMATFLTRALDLTIPDEPAGFTDVDPNSVHAPNIDALFAADITTGCNTEPLRYCPNQPVTRAHMATFLTRALDLPNRP